MRRFCRLLRWLAGVTVLVVLVAWFIGSSFLRPSNHIVSPPPDNLPCRTVSFKSGSGSHIHGWYVQVERPRGAVLLLHGSGGDRTSMLSHARFLRRANYACLMIDQRCHGESLGDSRTFGWLESRDAISAVAWLRHELPGLKIAVIGTSLGGASALLAKYELNADAIVAEQVYGSLRKAIWNRVRNRIGNLGADLFSPLLTIQVPLRLGVEIDAISPVKAARSVTCPVFVIHGENDRHADVEEGLAIYEACQNPSKEFWRVPDVGHVDLHNACGSSYEKRVLAFLDANLK